MSMVLPAIASVTRKSCPRVKREPERSPILPFLILLILVLVAICQLDCATATAVE